MSDLSKQVHGLIDHPGLKALCTKISYSPGLDRAEDVLDDLKALLETNHTDGRVFPHAQPKDAARFAKLLDELAGFFRHYGESLSENVRKGILDIIDRIRREQEKPQEDTPYLMNSLEQCTSPDMAPSNHDTFPCSRTENLSRRSDPGNLVPKAFSS